MTDRLSGIVDAVRQRVEEELRQQLAALTAEHERGLEEALREAAQTAERQAQEERLPKAPERKSAGFPHSRRK